VLKCFKDDLATNNVVVASIHSKVRELFTRVGTLIVATIYL